LGVIEDVRRADDVMKKSIGRRHAGADGEMIDEFGAEKGFGREFLDFLAVFGIVCHPTIARLGGGRKRKQEEEQQGAGKGSRHGSTSRQKGMRADYITSGVDSRTRGARRIWRRRSWMTADVPHKKRAFGPHLSHCPRWLR